MAEWRGWRRSKVTRHPVMGGRGFYSVLCPRCGAYGEVRYSPEEPITTDGKG